MLHEINTLLSCLKMPNSIMTEQSQHEIDRSFMNTREFQTSVLLLHHPAIITELIGHIP